MTQKITETNVVLPFLDAQAPTQVEGNNTQHRLGVAGFLNDDTFKREYLLLSRVRFEAYARNPLLTDVNETVTGQDSSKKLQEIILEGIQGMKDHYTIDGFTIVTPGLELLTKRMIEEIGVKFVSLSAAIAAECAQKKLKHVGLLGTKWDTAESSPLVTALKRRHIKSYSPPDASMSQMLTACAQLGASGIIYYQRPYKASDFCLEAVNSICETTPKLDGIVLCNPEFRWLAKKVTSRWPKLRIIDATQIHWQIMRNFIIDA